MTFFDIPNLLILLLALLIDLVLGEPPNPVHPVVWMGKLVSLLMKGAPGSQRSRTAQFLYGVIVTVLTIGIFSVAAYFVLAYIRNLNIVAYILVGAVLFKTMFSLRGLGKAALRVKNLLIEDKLPEARAAVKALVGRDTTQLDSGQVVSATVESVAENSCDSFVAPLLYFLLLGVPGALAYRAVNTLDNCIGFRGKYEYLGKFAARLDDVVNFVPARITAFIFVVAGWISRNDIRGAWRIMFRDHSKTASPNGGWTMGAMAGALGVQLEKVGYYKLGDSGNLLLPATIDASVTIMMLMALIWTLVLVILQVGFYVFIQA
jgi:adenosylcobinamide-phosphate synthase